MKNAERERGDEGNVVENKRDRALVNASQRRRKRKGGGVVIKSERKLADDRIERSANEGRKGTREPRAVEIHRGPGGMRREEQGVTRKE